MGDFGHKNQGLDKWVTNLILWGCFNSLRFCDL